MLVHQEREIIGLAPINDSLQDREHRKLERDRSAIAVFLLGEVKPSAAQMLPPKEHNIGAPLAGIEKEREREPRGAPYRMAFLVTLHLVNGPRVKPTLASAQV